MSGNKEAERTDVLEGGDRAVDEPADRVLDDSRSTESVPTTTCDPVTEGYKATSEEPPFVHRARAAWSDLLPQLPRRNLMRGVTIKWKYRHPHQEMKTSNLQAWTNSSTEVYVQCPDPQLGENTILEKVYWRILLYHEALHVVQFASSGGPPETYAIMMDHEIKAYGKTHEWLKTAQHPQQYQAVIEHNIDQMIEMRDTFCDEVNEAKQATAHIQDVEERRKQQNERYRNFLLEKELLPEHEDLQDLYGL
ncbi:hypothetical protein [Halorubrum sp. CSM-61]|uniref:hypothetical protein n=1 Tax=Halorubrum sp. CSM-61 TaxID=2485838 RepID=UPI000F4C4822|nr:hypothetical protein [Halorubrum sp. CSM-61]